MPARSRRKPEAAAAPRASRARKAPGSAAPTTGDRHTAPGSAAPTASEPHKARGSAAPTTGDRHTAPGSAAPTASDPHKAADPTAPALVFGLRQTRGGGIASSGVAGILERAAPARAVLIGPGVADPRATRALVAGLLPRLRGPETVVLDAGALDGLRDRPELSRGCSASVVLTPHAGETARLLGVDLEQVAADRLVAAREASSRFGAVVVLKGADTLVVEPSGSAHVYKEGRVGLATSGSGDTLAGVIAGLAARGASPVQAAVWGVYLHGEAGNRLNASVGQVGFLARELLAEVPRALASLAD